MLTPLEPYWLMVVPTLGTMVGLGFLLFIHEFGHFAVAKRAGVKVEIFSLGIAHFIFSWTWNGTVYALSWLPLGGYVRMAGQQDLAPPPNHKPKPWEYGAKKPLVRMAIIVAGVTMNFIGGWLCYSASFAIGRDVDPPWIGKLDIEKPGHKMAHDAGFRSGDKVLEVNGDRVYTRVGLDMRVARITPKTEIELLVEHRDGRKETVRVRTLPRMKGISTLTILDPELMPWKWETLRAGFTAEPVMVITPLPEELESKDFREWAKVFKPADIIESANGKRCRRPADFDEVLRHCGGQPIRLKVLGVDGTRREVLLAVLGADLIGVKFAAAEGPATVVGLEPGFPADKAGIKPGDRLYLGKGRKSTSVEEFKAAVQRAKGRPIAITAVSPGGEERLLRIAPRGVWFSDPGGKRITYYKSPMGFAQIVRKVDPDSMAERKGLKPGAILRTIVLARDPAAPIYATWAHKEEEYGPHKLELREEGSSITWRKRTQIRLDLGVGESLVAGWSETTETLLSTTVILRKVMNREVSPGKTLSGPISIVRVAYQSAQKGFGRMLWLLGLIGISLAFFNLLPIPVLDGGHLVFLGYEAIFHRPPPPRVVEIAQYTGLILILCLFVFVFGNDIFRWVQGR